GLVGRIDEAGRVEKDIDDIARHDAEQEEDDDRNPDQGHEHQSKAPHDIRKHLATPVDACFAKLDTGPAIRIPKIDETRWTSVAACSNLLVQPHVLIPIAVVGA